MIQLYTHKYFFLILLYYRLSQDIEYSSLCCKFLLFIFFVYSDVYLLIPRVCAVASVVLDSCVNLWNAACQTPLFMGFSSQEYWNELLCLPPGDLPDPGIEPVFLLSLSLAGRFFTSSITWEAHTPNLPPPPSTFPFGNCKFLLYVCESVSIS